MSNELDPELLRQLIEIFKVELEDQLQIITNNLLQIERGAKDEDRSIVLENMLRSAHNIKGAARSIGFNDISVIAHNLESLFGLLKQHTKTPSAEFFNICFESLDCMRKAMTAFNEKRAVDYDISDLVSRLNQFFGVNGKKESPKLASTHDFVNKDSISLDARIPLVAEQKSAAEVIRISVDKLEKMTAQIAQLQILQVDTVGYVAIMQQLRTQMQTFFRMWQHEISSLKFRKDLSIPIEVQDLLSVSTNALSNLNNVIVRAHRDIHANSNRFNVLSLTLQESARMIRLVSAGNLLYPMMRSARDIAQELGKQVEIKVMGEDVEMDRLVLDGVKDPLMHLLRNSIDHGIESAEQRTLQGKTEVGLIQMSVKSEGGYIKLTISDDGQGMDENEIAATACKKKIISENELAGMSRDEVINLIFRPGFSTKEIVSHISGRGVGLDVVLSNLRQLKGRIHVETTKGKGTTFILTLPLTLAADHGLLVRVAGAVYVVQSTSVERVMEVSPDKIVEVEANYVLLINNRAVPLREMASVLGLSSQNLSLRKSYSVIVVSRGWDLVAFIVDEIVGEREILIKPLKYPLVAVKNVIGGTLTGSGEVMIVLDSAELMDSAMQSPAVNLLSKSEKTKPLSRVLIVDDSITTRTLEKVILENAGYQVTVVVDGKQAWDMLQKQKFDLVITDIEMPVMDGFELTERIKASEILKQLPVIIVSSLASEENQQRGRDVGADAYIVKEQFETKALLDVVSQFL